MEFVAEHRFAGTPGAVAAVLADPAFYEDLDLPDLRLDAVVDGRGGGAGRAGAPLVLRYEYVGHLDPMARRLLGGDRLTWTQEVRFGPVTGGAGDPLEGQLRFRAEARPELLHGEARFSLDLEGASTVRRLRGDVVVALPVVGRMAEQRIVPGVLARLDVEADGVRRRLEADGPG